MQIDITKKEYRFLLDILSIADWVFTSHKIDRDRRVEKHGKIIQKFYSLAKEMGYEKLIEFDPNMKYYFPTKKYEDSGHFMEYIEEFENDTFWDELIYRLAMRDVVKKVGSVQKLSRLSNDERIKLFSSVEQQYEDEFEKHGIDHLKIENGEKA